MNEIVNELWDFIKNNVQILVNGAYLIMAIILLISRRKLPKSEKLTAIEPILEKLPRWIQQAEVYQGEKTGFTKLLYVLNLCMFECKEKGIEYNENYWKTQIEKILNTPQKKETENEKEN